MIELGANRYGKAAIRLVRVVRGPAGDRVRDLTVAIALEGDFEAAHTDGDNALVIATDTMKNTAYAFAKDHLDGSIEDYGRALAAHFLESPQVDVATVNIREHHWAAIDVAGTPAPGRVRPGRRGDARRDGHRDRRRDDRGGRGRGPHRDEDHALGVQRLPARPLHDPARDRRPADGDEGHGHLALRLAGARLRRACSRTSGRPSSRSSPTTTARPSRPRSGSWPAPSSSATTRSRRSGWSCPTSTTGWST